MAGGKDGGRTGGKWAVAGGKHCGRRRKVGVGEGSRRWEKRREEMKKKKKMDFKQDTYIIYIKKIFIHVKT